MSDKLQINIRLEPELAKRMHKCMAYDLIFNQSAFIRDAIIEACTLIEADMNKPTELEPDHNNYPNNSEGAAIYSRDIEAWRERTGWYNRP